MSVHSLVKILHRSMLWLVFLLPGALLADQDSPPLLSPEAAQQSLESWQTARQSFEVLARKRAKDPARAKLITRFRKCLGETETVLGDALNAMTTATRRDDPKVVEAVGNLRGKLGDLLMMQAQMKADIQLAGASSNVIGTLGTVLSQQKQEAGSAVRNLR